jgi:hypothetical protein
MREIPFVDLKAGFKPIRDEVMNAIGDVLEGMNLYLGPNCRAFEEEFASHCNAKYAIGVGSGTEAIQFALLARGIGEGDEVITSPHTFFATVEAIACIGARPVFADIDPATYNIDPEQVEKRITRRTRALIPVHMYGQTADMAPLTAISSKHGIPIIEDACQAHGARYKGGTAGTLGEAGCFSFYFTKNLGAYGEAGMVITDNEKIADRVRLYRNHGHRSKFEHAVMGYNGRLDEIQAAILRIKLKYLDEYTQKRRVRAAVYHSLLKDTPLSLPAEAEERTHVYHLYVVRSDRRDGLLEYLSGNGVGVGIHYRTPIHLQAALASFGFKEGDFPKAEAACREILSLPMYPELSEEDQIYISEKIKEFFSKGKI